MKPKSLIWLQNDAPDFGEEWFATVTAWPHSVGDRYGRYTVRFDRFEKYWSPTLWVGNQGHYLGENFRSKEDAQAFCQKDFNTRVLETVEPATPEAPGETVSKAGDALPHGWILLSKHDNRHYVHGADKPKQEDWAGEPWKETYPVYGEPTALPETPGLAEAVEYMNKIRDQKYDAISLISKHLISLEQAARLYLSIQKGTTK